MRLIGCDRREQQEIVFRVQVENGSVVVFLLSHGTRVHYAADCT